MAWWIPTALIVGGLLVTAPFRTGIWVAALAWMGIACLLNARQCGRTHCRYTGPYYRAMVVPVLMVGAGIIPLSLYGLLPFAIIILGGDLVGHRARVGQILNWHLAVANYRAKDVRF